MTTILPNGCVVRFLGWQAILQRVTAPTALYTRSLRSLPLEQALASLIEDGTLRRHARKARRIYQSRRDHLAGELIDRLGNELAFDVPAGGHAIWLRLRDGLSAETWAANTHRSGLAVTPGLKFVLDAASAPEAFRIGYASLDEKELTRFVGVLERTRPKPR